MTCAGSIFLHKPVKLHGWKREDFQNPFLGLLPAALKPFSQCISYPLWNAALAGEAPMSFVVTLVHFHTVPP